MNELDKVLAQLAQKLGTTIPHLWDVLIRQQYIDGVFSAMWIVVLLGLVYFTRKHHASLGRYDKGDFLPVVVIVCIIAMVGVPFAAYAIMTAVFNPEAGALSDLLGAMK